MVETEEGIANGQNNRISSTLFLTEELENGNLSPDAYIRRRTEIVGRGNIIQSVLAPILYSIFGKLWRFFNPNKGNDNPNEIAHQ